MAAFLSVQNGNCKYAQTQVVLIKNNNMSDSFDDFELRIGNPEIVRVSMVWIYHLIFEEERKTKSHDFFVGCTWFRRSSCFSSRN